MEFVSMDLIGEFHPPSSKGNRYALTAVCMLTGYTFAYPSKINQQKKLRQPGEIHIAFPFGVCRKLLTDNSTEFKNDLFPGLQNNLELKEKFIHLHTDHSQMVRLRDSTNFSKAA